MPWDNLKRKRLLPDALRRVSLQYAIDKKLASIPSAEEIQVMLRNDCSYFVRFIHYALWFKIVSVVVRQTTFANFLIHRKCFAGFHVGFGDFFECRNGRRTTNDSVLQFFSKI